LTPDRWPTWCAHSDSREWNTLTDKDRHTVMMNSSIASSSKNDAMISGTDSLARDTSETIRLLYGSHGLKSQSISETDSGARGGPHGKKKSHTSLWETGIEAKDGTLWNEADRGAQIRGIAKRVQPPGYCRGSTRDSGMAHRPDGRRSSAAA
jgi:hypothetical protein